MPVQQSKGLPDGTNMRMLKLGNEVYIVWREDDKDEIIWASMATSAAVASYLYAFED